MDKEKQQKMIGIVLFFLLALFGAYYVLIAPLLEDIDTKKTEKEGLQSRLTKANRIIRSKAKALELLGENKQVVELYTTNMPLPRNSEQSWLVNELGQLPKELKIEWATNTLGRIYSYGSKSNQPLKRGVKPKLVVLEDYIFNIDLTCGFHDFGKTVAWLEQKNPNCFVEAFDCSVDSSSKARVLKIGLKLAYPRFTKQAEKELEKTFKKGR